MNIVDDNIKTHIKLLHKSAPKRNVGQLNAHTLSQDAISNTGIGKERHRGRRGWGSDRDEKQRLVKQIVQIEGCFARFGGKAARVLRARSGIPRFVVYISQFLLYLSLTRPWNNASRSRARAPCVCVCICVRVRACVSVRSRNVSLFLFYIYIITEGAERKRQRGRGGSRTNTLVIAYNCIICWSALYNVQAGGRASSSVSMDRYVHLLSRRAIPSESNVFRRSRVDLAIRSPSAINASSPIPYVSVRFFRKLIDLSYLR